MLTKIIYFTSTDCAPNLDFGGVLKTILSNEKYKNEIEFQRFDIEDEEAQPLMMDYMIQTIPSAIFIDDTNEPIRKLRGKVPEKDLRRYIEYDFRKEIL